jgi:hypothetical protein
MTLVTSFGALVILFPPQNVAAVCVSVLIAEVVCLLYFSVHRVVVKWSCIVKCFGTYV